MFDENLTHFIELYWNYLKLTEIIFCCLGDGITDWLVEQCAVPEHERAIDYFIYSKSSGIICIILYFNFTGIYNQCLIVSILHFRAHELIKTPLICGPIGDCPQS